MKDALILKAVQAELDRANARFPGFNSPHEGYAVIKEELDELWDEIKLREPSKARMEAEAIQIAAMAIKFVMSL